MSKQKKTRKRMRAQDASMEQKPSERDQGIGDEHPQDGQQPDYGGIPVRDLKRNMGCG